MKTKRRISFDNVGVYFFALFLLAVAGFWPSYFSKFFDGTGDFNFYFHFHAVMAVVWIAFLITQPILIRRKNFQLHRFVGKISYLIVPLFFISIILLAHNRINVIDENLGASLWITFKDILIFSFGYGIAIYYRKQVPLHARGMIVAGIVLIEPALIRLILNLFFSGEFAPVGYLISIVLLYSLFIGLFIAERKHKIGRWVFPVAMGLYVFVHSVLIFQIKIGPWQAFAEWFAGLPLT